MQGLYHLVLSIFEFGNHFGGTVLAAGSSAGMGMNLSTTQAYVTFGSAGISGMGNMGGQPGGDLPAMPGSDNSSGNTI